MIKMNKAKVLPLGENDEMKKKTCGEPSGNAMKILVVGLITLAVIQVAILVVLIYLGARVGDLSSDVDNVEDNLRSEQSHSQQDPETPIPDQEISAGTLIFSDEFNDFNLTRWKHEITLGGGGNWEFQYYDNNRSNSYVKDGMLYLKPSFLVDDIGESALRGGYNFDLWGSQPATFCTGPYFYGCFRTSGAGGNILNPLRSARIRTAESFNFKYDRIEVKAQLPVGNWLWPAI